MMDVKQMFYNARRDDVLARRRLGREGRIAYRHLILRAVSHVTLSMRDMTCLRIIRDTTGHIDISAVNPYR